MRSTPIQVQWVHMNYVARWKLISEYKMYIMQQYEKCSQLSTDICGNMKTALWVQDIYSNMKIALWVQNICSNMKIALLSTKYIWSNIKIALLSTRYMQQYENCSLQSEADCEAAFYSLCIDCSGYLHWQHRGRRIFTLGTIWYIKYAVLYIVQIHSIYCSVNSKNKKKIGFVLVTLTVYNVQYSWTSTFVLCVQCTYKGCTYVLDANNSLR